MGVHIRYAVGTFEDKLSAIVLDPGVKGAVSILGRVSLPKPALTGVLDSLRGAGAGVQGSPDVLLETLMNCHGVVGPEILRAHTLSGCTPS